MVLTMPLVFFLTGCDVEIAGSVVGPAGVPVAGASVESGGCTAVTDASGQFRTRCLRDTYDFVVTHPTHSTGRVAVDASGAMSPLPATVEVLAWPAEPGLYHDSDFSPLTPAVVSRTVTADEQKFCLTGPIPATKPGNITVFEVGGHTWRALALDAEGCAYRLVKAAGSTVWTPVETRIAETSRETLAPGRARVVLSVTGPTILAAWYDGFWVPADPVADTWLSWQAE